MSTNRLIISNFRTGLEKNLEPFNISNDAFPVLENAYIWRGKALRKRGIQSLARLRRDLEDVDLGNTGASPWSFNLYSTVTPAISNPDAQLVPGTVVITITGPIVFTDQGDGTLTSATAGNSGTIDYSTGDIVLTHTAGAGIATTVTFSYLPALPVMGLEDFNVGNSPQPILLAFDTEYSYQFNQGTNLFYDTTFYKTTDIPFIWNGENYDQFWTTNYLGTTSLINTAAGTGCLWATNGNPGVHFLNATYTAGTGTATWDITFTDPSANPFQTLQIGDILWFNEWSGSTDVNGISGTVSDDTNAATGQYKVDFAISPTIAVTFTGIVQMMTNFLPDEDGIRWYDGDPNSAAPPTNPGWVNFAPPLSEYDATTNPNPQYLVGCKVIIPFKNRLLCGGVYLRTSSGPLEFLPNRFVFSQVGTPYYSNPMPAPLSTLNPDPAAWYQIIGRGGFVGAPIDDNIVTVGENDDLLIVLFESQPLKLIFTSNDTLPFVFQAISAELGGLGTFAGIKLDEGLLSVGTYGFTMTTSTSVQRIDLQIPDEVFDVGQASDKDKRITAVRDYQKEYVYFTFCPANRSNDTFNTRTLLYNYRENTWAQFEETFTTYGTLRRTTNRTWANIGEIYPTWNKWNDPWDYGLGNAFQPVIIGGNQQGFVMQRSYGTSEQPSKFIQSVSGTLITSPDHGLQTGNFIEIQGMLGSTNLNGMTQQVTVASPDTFNVNEPATGTYIGGGVYTVLSRPIIQTKQFPVYWQEGRQARIGPTRLLLEANSYPEEDTSFPQITMEIYSSQNSNLAGNDPTIDPYFAFSDIVLTCPEIDTAFGASQAQIWHRVSTSINGSTIQLGFTLSDSQMLDSEINQQEIIIHAITMDLNKGPIIA